MKENLKELEFFASIETEFSYADVDEMYPCACCGSLTLSEIGAYEICDVCGWEDDPVQSRDPEYAGGGANSETLSAARERWARRGNEI